MHVDVPYYFMRSCLIGLKTQKTALHPGYPDTGEQELFHSSLGEWETTMLNK